MENDKITLSDSNFDLDFLTESDIVSTPPSHKSPYKILIADDESSMHSATRLLLKDFHFEGHSLHLIDTYSARETLEVLSQHSDIAVIFLDVVMEENDSGLKVVDYIRKVLRNKNIRIILRTGQPGEAPEERIIAEYDINDYRLKTELTAQRLYTTMYEALRSYRDIMELEHNRKGLEHIISTSSQLFTLSNIEDFYSCILDQLLGFRDPEASAFFFREGQREGGFIFLHDQTFGTIVAATGKYAAYIGKNILDIPEIKEVTIAASNYDPNSSSSIIPVGPGYLICKGAYTGPLSFIYIENADLDFDIQMIETFLTNYSQALDHFIITQYMIKAQRDFINSLGDTVEIKTYESGNHVRRIVYISSLLAQSINLNEEIRGFLEIACTVHDIGKLAIPEEILTKPGPLTDKEFEVIKQHAVIGHQILSSSNLEVLKWSATIAHHHHERYDGTGYPQGLKGEAIPLCARIVQLADVLDALTHKLYYKEAWPFDRAIEYIKAHSNTQFDPSLVQILLNHLKEVKNILAAYPD